MYGAGAGERCATGSGVAAAAASSAARWSSARRASSGVGIGFVPFT